MRLNIYERAVNFFYFLLFSLFSFFFLFDFFCGVFFLIKHHVIQAFARSFTDISPFSSQICEYVRVIMKYINILKSAILKPIHVCFFLTLI